MRQDVLEDHRQQTRRYIGLDDRRRGEQRQNDIEEERRDLGECSQDADLLVSAHARGHARAEVQSRRAEEHERGQLKDAVGEDADEVDAKA